MFSYFHRLLSSKKDNVKHSMAKIVPGYNISNASAIESVKSSEHSS